MLLDKMPQFFEAFCLPIQAVDGLNGPYTTGKNRLMQALNPRANQTDRIDVFRRHVPDTHCSQCARAQGGQLGGVHQGQGETRFGIVKQQCSIGYGQGFVFIAGNDRNQLGCKISASKGGHTQEGILPVVEVHPFGYTAGLVFVGHHCGFDGGGDFLQAEQGGNLFVVEYEHRCRALQSQLQVFTRFELRCFFEYLSWMILQAK